jgi:hypothetical protein
MKTISVFLVFISTSLLGTPKTWAQSDQPEPENLLALISTDDGGFIAVGYCDDCNGTLPFRAPKNNGRNGIVTKFSAHGEIRWSKDFGESGNDVLQSVIATPDGYYIASGYSGCAGEGDCRGWLLKFNTYGDVIWSHTYGIDKSNYFYSIAAVPNGQLLAIGKIVRKYDSQEKYREMETYGWIVKVNANGEVILSKEYDDSISTLSATQDGFIIMGYRKNSNWKDWNIWRSKIDNEANPVWAEEYADNKRDSLMKTKKYPFSTLHSIIPTPDGGYIAVGSSHYTEFKNWLSVLRYRLLLCKDHSQYGLLMKVNSHGKMVWRKDFKSNSADQGNFKDDYLNAGALLSDGSLVAVGRTSSLYMSGSWVIKFDKKGKKSWSKTWEKDSGIRYN